MNIGINVSFLRKRGAGIGEVTYHFLTELVRKVGEGAVPSSVRFTLYAEEDFTLPALDMASQDVQARFCKNITLPPYRRDDLIRKVWWEKYQLPRMIREDGCDVFLSLYQCPTIITSARHIMLVHDLVPRLFPQYIDNFRKRAYQWLSEKAITRADHIIAVSRRTEKDVIKELAIAPEKISVQYIDCDPIFKNKSYGSVARNHNTVLAQYGLKAGAYIYTGGGLDMRKNVQNTLRAYARLRQWHKDGDDMEHPVPQLVISGKLLPELAPLVTDVERLIEELHLTAHVKVLGFVPQEDLPSLYGGALFFLYPSLYEGFGLPVLEAMAMRTPVLTAQTSSLPEVGADAVLYCNPYDIADIAQKMRTLIEDKGLRQHLRARTTAQANKFSWKKFTVDMINIILQR